MPNNPNPITADNTTTVRTVCTPNCCNSCGITAHVRDGKVVKVEPAAFPDSRFNRICLKGLSSLQRLYHPDRLKYPLKRVGERGAGQWQRISWDEATDLIASNLSAIRDKYGARAIAFSTLTGTYARITRAAASRFASIFGGSEPGGAALMGDLAGPMGMELVLGRACGHEPTDWVNSRFIISWGRNIAESYMNDIRFLLDAKEQGAKLVVIDPRFTPTASKADRWLPVRVGTDTALALGMINIIIREKLYDKDYVARRTVGPYLVRQDNGKYLRESDIASNGSGDSYVVWEGDGPRVAGSSKAELRGRYRVKGMECATAFERLAELAEGYPLERVSELTGVDANRIYELAVEYARSKPSAILLAQGATRSFHGHNVFRAIITLAAITGNIGVPGGGASHIFFWPMLNSLNISGVHCPDGLSYHALPGMMLYPAIAEGKPWPIKAAWFVGYNFINQAPNQNRQINELLPKLEFLVVSEQFMTVTAKYADVVLPATTFYESEDLVSSFHHFYLQLQQAAVERVGECKPDMEAFSLVARKMGFGQYFEKDTKAYIEEFLNSGEQVLEGVNYERLQREKVVRINVPEPYIPFADGVFPTPSGKIEFYNESLTEIGQALPTYLEPLEGPNSELASKYPLNFITGHSRFSANSQHFRLDWVREVNPEPRLDINPVDAEPRGIKSGDTVEVYNNRGKCGLRARVTQGIVPGVVNIDQGWWPQDFVSGSFQELTQDAINPDQSLIKEPNWATFDCLVEVKRIETP